MSQIVDRGCRIAIPLLGEFTEIAKNRIVNILSTSRCRFTHRQRAGVEDLAHHFKQHFNARIGDRIFPSKEQREQALEAKDVPRIDKTTALNSAMQQIDDFCNQPPRFVEFALAHDAWNHDQSRLDF